MNLRIVIDAAYEIARHRFGKPVRSNQHGYINSVLREKHRRLTSRVPSTDDDHLLAFAELRFHRRCEVVDAGSIELAEVLDWQSAIFRAGSDDDGSSGDASSVLDLHRVRPCVAAQMRGAFGDDHLYAEFLSLSERTRRELLTGDAGRKAEIVLDAHAGAGLSARRVCFDHQHIETF